MAIQITPATKPVQMNQPDPIALSLIHQINAAISLMDAIETASQPYHDNDFDAMGLYFAKKKLEEELILLKKACRG